MDIIEGVVFRSRDHEYMVKSSVLDTVHGCLLHSRLGDHLGKRVRITIEEI